MKTTNLKQTALMGLTWQMLEKITVNGSQFLIFIILARLLSPKDFGIIALITAFISINDLLINSGLGTALVQKLEVDEEDYSSVFYTSLGISLVLYLVFFGCSTIYCVFL